MQSIFLILASLAAFAVVHSVLASLAAKAWAQRTLGRRVADGVYRLVYNLIAVVTVVPPFALALLLPDEAALWRIPPALLWVTVPAQVGALAGMALSLWRVDLPGFLGWRQFTRFVTGQPEPIDPPALRTDGIHGWVRHPLYFFSLVFMWLFPELTPNRFALAAGITTYFWIGSIFEERKLVHDFGDAYRAHQARVPRLFPWPRPRGHDRQ